MRVSLPWLERYFDKPLKLEQVVDGLTFHVFEVEGVKGEPGHEVLEVNVLPDRACYALSHRGIAREVATILDLSFDKDSLRQPLPEWSETNLLELSIVATEKCSRNMGALIRGVKVGPSPVWLKEALESVGQKSINNVVDATNFVTLDMGQPLHAFDASKIPSHDGKLSVCVRETTGEESITALSGEAYELPEGTLVIAETVSGTPLDIAGIKGGMASSITEDTTDLYISAANFDGSSIRKTAQKLKLWTDASLRFQNNPSPTLVAYGMREVLALVQELAGGELLGVIDIQSGLPYERLVPLSVSLVEIQALLGSPLEADQVVRVFDRLGFTFVENAGVFSVTPPFERRDLNIAQDLIEEIGRTFGYEYLSSKQLPELETLPDQRRYRGIERIKDFLAERGFAEISTPSFAITGDIELANPLAMDKPMLRASLLPNMYEALKLAATMAPRVMGTISMVKLFEVGNVFTNDGEFLMVALGCKDLSGTHGGDIFLENVATLEQELFNAPAAARYNGEGDIVEINLSKVDLEKLGEVEGKPYEPLPVSLGAYHSFSIYPFALRDIAVWTPSGTEESEIANLLLKEGGPLLARIDLFDRFEKDDRISYAFRLVFESMEHTLSDADLNPLMEAMTKKLNATPGFRVR